MLYFVLKIMGDGRRRGKRQRGVPNHLPFLPGRLHQRGVLSQRNRGANGPQGKQYETACFSHLCLLNDLIEVRLLSYTPTPFMAILSA
jgi:hypothetical protein